MTVKSAFPMIWAASFFDNAVNFRLKGNKTFLGVKFNKHTRFTFRVREEEGHYALVTSSSHYEVLRSWQEYHFRKDQTQVECWTDSKMVDHIKLTVQLSNGSSESLELIRG